MGYPQMPRGHIQHTVYRRAVHENPIGDGCVMAVYVDSAHNLWVSCDNDGVYCLDQGGRRIAYYPTPTTVMCILEDSRSRMWIGSFNFKHAVHFGPVKLDKRRTRGYIKQHITCHKFGSVTFGTGIKSAAISRKGLYGKYTAGICNRLEIFGSVT